MNKSLKIILLILVLAFILIPGYFVFPFMSVMLFVWTLMIFLAKKYGYINQLKEYEKKSYLITIVTYPILETFIKWMIIGNVIPYSWFWLNRLEHFLASLSIGILFYPFLKQTLRKLNTWECLIFWVCFVNMIGVGNEIFEYVIRHYMGIYEQPLYYLDTIHDMTTNIFGALTGFFILKRVRIFSRIRIIN